MVARRIDTGELSQLCYVGPPAWSIEVGNGIGTEGRKHALAQTVGGQLDMVAEVRGGRVCRRDDLDIEAIKQFSRAESRVGNAIGDLVIDGIRGFGTRNLINAEDLDELVLQPIARRRTAEELPILAEGVPDLPRVGLDRATIEPRHSKASRLDALRCQHAEHVMIRNYQQLRRVGERRILREHLWFHVSVHADKRQILRRVIDFSGDAPLLCRERKSAVRVELEGRHYFCPSCSHPFGHWRFCLPPALERPAEQIVPTIIIGGRSRFVVQTEPVPLLPDARRTVDSFTRKINTEIKIGDLDRQTGTQ